VAENLDDHNSSHEGDTSGNQPPSDPFDDDIAGMIAALRLSEPTWRTANDSHEEASRYIRGVSDGVLNRLAGMGAKSADHIAVTLKVLDQGEDQSEASLDDAAVLFKDLALQVQDQDRGRWLKLKQLGSLAHAVHSLASAQAVRGMMPGDSSTGTELINIAHRNIFDEAENLPEDSRLPLQTLLGELELTVQPLPPRQ